MDWPKVAVPSVLKWAIITQKISNFNRTLIQSLVFFLG